MAEDPGRDPRFRSFTRAQWSRFAGQGEALRRPTPPATADGDGVGDAVDPEEVADVYLPLARWIEDRVASGERPSRRGARTPAVIGITGSVAAGKSTIARVLTQLLGRGAGRPAVELLTTDGFLYPNRVLEQRGLLDRKGFPETYDHHALVAVLEAVRSGRPEVGVPVYSHQTYDVVPGAVQRIRAPDLLVVEGLTVLQGASGGGGQGAPGPEGLIDLALYVDAAEEDLARWLTDRLLALRTSGAGASSDFLRWLSSLSETEARQLAASAWSEVNLVNLREHVAPTRSRADLVLEKGADHRVRRVLVRTGAPPMG